MGRDGRLSVITVTAPELPPNNGAGTKPIRGFDLCAFSSRGTL
jgi:hypothetical protein